QNSLSRQLAEWEVTHDGVRERNRRISDTMPLTLTADHRFRHSFPTRRSSDLDVVEKHKPGADVRPLVEHDCQARDRGVRGIDTNRLDGRRDIRAGIRIARPAVSATRSVRGCVTTQEDRMIAAGIGDADVPPGSSGPAPPIRPVLPGQRGQRRRRLTLQPVDYRETGGEDRCGHHLLEVERLVGTPGRVRLPLVRLPLREGLLPEPAGIEPQAGLPATDGKRGPAGRRTRRSWRRRLATGREHQRGRNRDENSACGHEDLRQDALHQPNCLGGAMHTEHSCGTRARHAILAQREAGAMTTFVKPTEAYQQGQRTLLREYYTTPEIYGQEMERIFSRRWLCVGRAAELADSGDF